VPASWYIRAAENEGTFSFDMGDSKDMPPAGAAELPIPVLVWGREFRECMNTVKAANKQTVPESAGKTLESQKIDVCLKACTYAVHYRGFPPNDPETLDWPVLFRNTARESLVANPLDYDVTKSALQLLRELWDRQKLCRDDVEVSDSIKSALHFWGDKFALLDLARGILMPMGHLRQDTPSKVGMLQALQRAKTLQAQGATDSDVQVVYDCVVKLLRNANWALMDPEEQDGVKDPVAQFAKYCMQNYDHGKNVHVGMKGVELMYAMAAGCMQQNDERLIEADRIWLCGLDLGQSMMSFGSSTHDDAEKVDWLFDRMQRPREAKRKLDEAAGAL